MWLLEEYVFFDDWGIGVLSVDTSSDTYTRRTITYAIVFNANDAQSSRVLNNI